MDPKRLYLRLLTLATAALLIAALLPYLSDGPEPPGGSPPRLADSLATVPPVPQRVRILGYEREHFGSGWAPAPVPHAFCTTRDLIIATAVAQPPGPDCSASGETVDPYTGKELDISPDAEPVEIDHILPLSAAWDLGAHAWSFEERLSFANDPRNLVLTSRKANQQKSDLLPATWLPEDSKARCWYARRLAHVAAIYALPLPAEDLRAMKIQCRLSEIIGG
ncbi:HNH endonuclease family protein [Corynebacterium sp. A21]|uniref:HNH endonuclease family protein n=1 Tax=Corynebacterium sp. A21 TaxID=3457318 RepID=UPI003FD51E52